MNKYLAIDQYGNKIVFQTDTRHPRKALLEHVGGKHAQKMYVDKLDGSSVHVGYIVAGCWWKIYNVTSWEGK
jgi:hypothetical protein